MSKSKPNSFCPVPGCKTTAPHVNDMVVSGLTKVFPSPETLAYWSLASMVDLRKSIAADIESDRPFAWQTRIRQVEEIYFRALYTIFFATPDELPHIFSGATPNSVVPMYRKVNEEILKGQGQWEVKQQGLISGDFTPLSLMHSSAHASYVAMMTAISYSRAPDEEVKKKTVESFIKHLDTYCGRLDYINKMVKAGRDKQVVMDAMISLHRPVSHWTSGGTSNP